MFLVVCKVVFHIVKYCKCVVFSDTIFILEQVLMCDNI